MLHSLVKCYPVNPQEIRHVYVQMCIMKTIQFRDQFTHQKIPDKFCFWEPYPFKFYYNSLPF